MASPGYAAIDPSLAVQVQSTDNLVFRHRVKLLRFITTELEEENNMIAYKIAKTRRRIEAKRAAIVEAAAAAAAARARAAASAARSRSRARARAAAAGAPGIFGDPGTGEKRSFWEKGPGSGQLTPLSQSQGQGQGRVSTAGSVVDSGVDSPDVKPGQQDLSMPKTPTIPLEDARAMLSRSRDTTYTGLSTHPPQPIPLEDARAMLSAAQARNNSNASPKPRAKPRKSAAKSRTTSAAPAPAIIADEIQLDDMLSSPPMAEAGYPPQSSDGGMEVDDDIDDY